MEFERYELNEVDKTNLPAFRYRKQVRRLKPPFLRGPIPLNWLQKAMKLGGGAISVGIILWYYRGLKKLSVFKIGIQDIANLIGRSWLTAKRGIIALEHQGLITIQRHNGRKHIIEIREVDEETNSSTFLKKPKGGKNDSREG